MGSRRNGIGAAVRINSFSVVGEALNFGSRRFAVVAKLALLPVSLLLIFNMAMVFVAISVSYGRVITFADFAPSAPYQSLSQMALATIATGLLDGAPAFWIISGAYVAINAVLVASFMAPAIRYAGLGERPARGLIRVPFGEDQLRYVVSQFLSFLLATVVTLAPIALASWAVMKAVAGAVEQSLLHYPDTNSLHTVVLQTGQDLARLRGDLWLYEWGYWTAAALGAVVLLIFVLFQHLRNAGRSTLSSALFAILPVAIYLLALWALLAPTPMTQGAAESPITYMVAAAVGLLAYANVRLYPYTGVAVCERSVRLRPSLSLTRGRGVFGVLGSLLLLLIVVALTGFAVSAILAPAILSVVMSVGAAVSSFVRFQFGFDEFSLVQSFFAWLVALAQIILNIAWTIFSYAVLAGLWGRLYRESARLAR